MGRGGGYVFYFVVVIVFYFVVVIVLGLLVFYCGKSFSGIYYIFHVLWLNNMLELILEWDVAPWVSAHGVMGCSIEASWHFVFQPVPYTGITNAMVCAILSGLVHIKDPLQLIQKISLCSGFPYSLAIWLILYHTSYTI